MAACRRDRVAAHAAELIIAVGPETLASVVPKPPRLFPGTRVLHASLSW
jgi:hypothetical protein